MATHPALATTTAAAPRAHSGIRAVLLDLDGTLLDTAPDLVGAANALLAEQGRAEEPAGVFGPVVSHGSAAMIARAFAIHPDDTRMESLRSRFLELYAERVSRRTRPFPGIPELLDALDARGIRWGVVTNKPGWLTEPLLRDLDLARRCGCIVSGDTLPWRKPHPGPIERGCELIGVPPARTIVFGDARRDIEAGRRAGTLTLAALFGYICAEDEPARWGADGLIGHPMELLRWLAPHAPAQVPGDSRTAADGSS